MSLKTCVKKFYEDRYLISHKSRVLEVENTDRGFLVRPEEVIFFPGGGGQAKDTGLIEVLKKDGSFEGKSFVFDVLDVDEDDRGVYLVVDHYAKETSYDDSEEKIDGSISCATSDNHNLNVDIDISVGDVIFQKVDGYHRFDNMHQHTGQHLLSGCFYTLFERNTLSLHIGKEVSQLDIQGEFDDDMVRKVEDMANKIISEGVDLLNYELTPEEKKNLVTRRPLPVTDDPIRILEIPDIDINACCGVHAKNTRDLRFVRIKRYYKRKGNTRFEYLVGDRAINYVLNRDRLMDEINLMYSTSEENLKNALQNDKSRIEDLIEEKKNIRSRLFNYMSSNLLDKLSGEDLNIIDLTELEIDDFYEEFISYISDRLNAVLIYRYNVDDRFFVKAYISKDASNHYGVDLSKDTKSFREGKNLKGGGNAISLTIFSEDKQEVDKFQDCIYHIYGK